MVYLFSGSDRYRMLKRIQKLALEHTSVSASFLDANEDNDFEYFITWAKSNSLFDTTSAIALYSNSGREKEMAEKINKYNIADDNTKILFIILSDTAVTKKNKKKDSSLNSISEIESNKEIFEPLAGAQLSKWLEEEIKQYECSIEPSALKQLIESQNGISSSYPKKQPADSWHLALEINKLAAYCHFNQKKIIEKNDVALLVPYSAENKIFDLLDAIAGKQKKNALILLHKHLIHKQDPSYIVSMLIYQFRMLIMVKSALESNIPQERIAQECAIHPYVASKTAHHAKKHTLTDLKNYFGITAEIDNGLRDGTIDPTDALFDIVFSLT